MAQVTNPIPPFDFSRVQGTHLPLNPGDDGKDIEISSSYNRFEAKSLPPNKSNNRRMHNAKQQMLVPPHTNEQLLHRKTEDLQHLLARPASTLFGRMPPTAVTTRPHLNNIEYDLRLRQLMEELVSSSRIENQHYAVHTLLPMELKESYQQRLEAMVAGATATGTTPVVSADKPNLTHNNRITTSNDRVNYQQQQHEHHKDNKDFVNTSSFFKPANELLFTDKRNSTLSKDTLDATKSQISSSSSLSSSASSIPFASPPMSDASLKDTLLDYVLFEYMTKVKQNLTKILDINRDDGNSSAALPNSQRIRQQLEFLQKNAEKFKKFQQVEERTKNATAVTVWDILKDIDAIQQSALKEQHLLDIENAKEKDYIGKEISNGVKEDRRKSDSYEKWTNSTNKNSPVMNSTNLNTFEEFSNGNKEYDKGVHLIENFENLRNLSASGNDTSMNLDSQMQLVEYLQNIQKEFQLMQGHNNSIAGIGLTKSNESLLLLEAIPITMETNMNIPIPLNEDHLTTNNSRIDSSIPVVDEGKVDGFPENIATTTRVEFAEVLENLETPNKVINDSKDITTEYKLTVPATNSKIPDYFIEAQTESLTTTAIYENETALENLKNSLSNTSVNENDRDSEKVIKETSGKVRLTIETSTEKLEANIPNTIQYPLEFEFDNLSTAKSKTKNKNPEDTKEVQLEASTTRTTTKMATENIEILQKVPNDLEESTEISQLEETTLSRTVNISQISATNSQVTESLEIEKETTIKPQIPSEIPIKSLKYQYETAIESADNIFNSSQVSRTSENPDLPIVITANNSEKSEVMTTNLIPEINIETTQKPNIVNLKTSNVPINLFHTPAPILESRNAFTIIDSIEGESRVNTPDSFESQVTTQVESFHRPSPGKNTKLSPELSNPNIRGKHMESLETTQISNISNLEIYKVKVPLNLSYNPLPILESRSVLAIIDSTEGESRFNIPKSDGSQITAQDEFFDRPTLGNSSKLSPKVSSPNIRGTHMEASVYKLSSENFNHTKRKTPSTQINNTEIELATEFPSNTETLALHINNTENKSNTETLSSHINIIENELATEIPSKIKTLYPYISKTGIELVTELPSNIKTPPTYINNTENGPTTELPSYTETLQSHNNIIDSELTTELPSNRGTLSSHINKTENELVTELPRYTETMSLHIDNTENELTTKLPSNTETLPSHISKTENELAHINKTENELATELPSTDFSTTDFSENSELTNKLVDAITVSWSSNEDSSEVPTMLSETITESYENETTSEIYTIQGNVYDKRLTGLPMEETTPLAEMIKIEPPTDDITLENDEITNKMTQYETTAIPLDKVESESISELPITAISLEHEETTASTEDYDAAINPFSNKFENLAIELPTTEVIQEFTQIPTEMPINNVRQNVELPTSDTKLMEGNPKDTLKTTREELPAIQIPIKNSTTNNDVFTELPIADFNRKKNNSTDTLRTTTEELDFTTKNSIQILIKNTNKFAELLISDFNLTIIDSTDSLKAPTEEITLLIQIQKDENSTNTPRSKEVVLTTSTEIPTKLTISNSETTTELPTPDSYLSGEKTKNITKTTQIVMPTSTQNPTKVAIRNIANTTELSIPNSYFTRKISVDYPERTPLSTNIPTEESTTNSFINTELPTKDSSIIHLIEKYIDESKITTEMPIADANFARTEYIATPKPTTEVVTHSTHVEIAESTTDSDLTTELPINDAEMVDTFLTITEIRPVFIHSSTKVPIYESKLKAELPITYTSSTRSKTKETPETTTETMTTLSQMHSPELTDASILATELPATNTKFDGGNTIDTYLATADTKTVTVHSSTEDTIQKIEMHNLTKESKYKSELKVEFPINDTFFTRTIPTNTIEMTTELMPTLAKLQIKSSTMELTTTNTKIAYEDTTTEVNPTHSYIPTADAFYKIETTAELPIASIETTKEALSYNPNRHRTGILNKVSASDDGITIVLPTIVNKFATENLTEFEMMSHTGTTQIPEEDTSIESSIMQDMSTNETYLTRLDSSDIPKTTVTATSMPNMTDFTLPNNEIKSTTEVLTTNINFVTKNISYLNNKRPSVITNSSDVTQNFVPTNQSKAEEVLPTIQTYLTTKEIVTANETTSVMETNHTDIQTGFTELEDKLTNELPTTQTLYPFLKTVLKVSSQPKADMLNQGMLLIPELPTGNLENEQSAVSINDASKLNSSLSGDFKPVTLLAPELPTENVKIKPTTDSTSATIKSDFKIPEDLKNFEIFPLFQSKSTILKENVEDTGYVPKFQNEVSENIGSQIESSSVFKKDLNLPDVEVFLQGITSKDVNSIKDVITDYSLQKDKVVNSNNSTQSMDAKESFVNSEQTETTPPASPKKQVNDTSEKHNFKSMNSTESYKVIAPIYNKPQSIPPKNYLKVDKVMTLKHQQDLNENQYDSLDIDDSKLKPITEIVWLLQPSTGGPSISRDPLGIPYESSLNAQTLTTFAEQLPNAAKLEIVKPQEAPENRMDELITIIGNSLQGTSGSDTKSQHVASEVTRHCQDNNNKQQQQEEQEQHEQKHQGPKVHDEGTETLVNCSSGTEQTMQLTTLPSTTLTATATLAPAAAATTLALRTITQSGLQNVQMMAISKTIENQKDNKEKWTIFKNNHLNNDSLTKASDNEDAQMPEIKKEKANDQTADDEDEQEEQEYGAKDVEGVQEGDVPNKSSINDKDISLGTKVRPTTEINTSNNTPVEAEQHKDDHVLDRTTNNVQHTDDNTFNISTATKTMKTNEPVDGNVQEEDEQGGLNEMSTIETKLVEISKDNRNDMTITGLRKGGHDTNPILYKVVNDDDADDATTIGLKKDYTQKGNEHEMTLFKSHHETVSNIQGNRETDYYEMTISPTSFSFDDTAQDEVILANIEALDAVDQEVEQLSTLTDTFLNTQSFPDVTPYHSNLHNKSHRSRKKKQKLKHTDASVNAHPKEEITTTNWWHSLPYAEIRKFLSSIFDSVQDW